MKIYVAGSSKNFVIPQLVMKLLVKDGYEITHDWSCEVKDNLLVDLTESEMESIAIIDAKAVMDADVVVLVYHDGQGCGKYTELGIAIGKNIDVIVFAPYCQKTFGNKVFFFHPGVHAHVYSYEDLVKELKLLIPPKFNYDKEKGLLTFKKALTTQDWVEVRRAIDTPS